MFRLGKLVQRFTDAFELPVIDYIFHRLGADRSDLEFAATLLGVPAARIVDDQPRMTRAAYPMNRARSRKDGPPCADMSRYASWRTVVTPMLIGAPCRASSRLAGRRNSEYSASHSAPAAA